MTIQRAMELADKFVDNNLAPNQISDGDIARDRLVQALALLLVRHSK